MTTSSLKSAKCCPAKSRAAAPPRRSPSTSPWATLSRTWPAPGPSTPSPKTRPEIPRRTRVLTLHLIGYFEVVLCRVLREASMAQNTPVEVVRQASTVSVVWGVLLIVFGMVAVGSPFLAAVAVNVIVAWLIVLAGVVHLMLAFRAHGAGSMLWKLLVGVAYLCFGGYLIARPVIGVASLTLLLASLFLIEGILDIVLYVK